MVKYKLRMWDGGTGGGGGGESEVRGGRLLQGERILQRRTGLNKNGLGVRLTYIKSPSEKRAKGVVEVNAVHRLNFLWKK